MPGAMSDSSDDRDYDDEPTIMTQLLEFNGNDQPDEATHIEMTIDGSVRMRNKLFHRLLFWADKLDAEKERHDEEMALLRQQSDEKDENLKREIRSIENTLDQLKADNAAKTVTNLQAKELLQVFYDRKKTHAHASNATLCSN